MKNETLIWRK